MTALYKLATEYGAIMLRLEEGGGEITEELEALLDGVGGAFADKVDAVAAMVRTLRSDARQFAEEAAFFKERAKASEVRAEALEEYLRRCLVEAQTDEVRGARFRVVRRMNPASVQTSVAVTELPEQYQRVKTVYEVDKTKLKAALEGGAEVPGAWLERKERIEIK